MILPTRQALMNFNSGLKQHSLQVGIEQCNGLIHYESLKSDSLGKEQQP